MKRILANEFDQMNSKEEERKRARFFNSLSGIKMPVLIGTQDNEKRPNLAIFSSLVHLGANPALMGIVSRPSSVQRHTIDNIQETGHYSVNTIPFHLARNAHLTSARFSSDENEFEKCELHSDFRGEGKCPHVEESGLSWTMEYIRTISIEENDTSLIIGRVREVFVDEAIEVDDGVLNISKLDPLLCCGLENYFNIGEKNIRFKYAKPSMKLSDL